MDMVLSVVGAWLVLALLSAAGVLALVRGAKAPARPAPPRMYELVPTGAVPGQRRRPPV